MTRFRFDQFCFDGDQKALLRGGEPVRLTPRAFRLLEMLLMRHPKAVSKRELLDYVWSGHIVEEANLKTLVLEIRTALEERGGRPEVLRTVYGFGYAFTGQVEELDSPEPTAIVSVRWNAKSALLPLGSHRIGRRPDCAVSIVDPSVSRVHAVLEITRDTIRIEDLRSKNGTYVDGRRITDPVELLNRCEILVGEVSVKIARLDLGDVSTETAAPRLT
jgi:DNA-binding winged helix-turn-helix (wHTH) protein